jgi:hypothetical protein
MIFAGVLLLLLTMAMMVSIIGRRVSDLAPVRLRPIYRFYFSPLLGLAVMILVCTVYGWIAPFKTKPSLFITLALIFPSIYFEKNKKELMKYLFTIAGFAIIASSAVLMPILLFDSYNSFNDTFTYLAHGQWLQSHPFYEWANPNGNHPYLTQISLYQQAGSRMGASFFLGYAQSLFHINWSYYVLPAVVSIPLMSGALAVGGGVKLIVRGQRIIDNL